MEWGRSGPRYLTSKTSDYWIGRRGSLQILSRLFCGLFQFSSFVIKHGIHKEKADMLFEVIRQARRGQYFICRTMKMFSKTTRNVKCKFFDTARCMWDLSKHGWDPISAHFSGFAE